MELIDSASAYSKNNIIKNTLVSGTLHFFNICTEKIFFYDSYQYNIIPAKKKHEIKKETSKYHKYRMEIE